MDLIVVLDTNAYSDWRRSDRWHANIAIADRVVLPSIVLGELLHGFGKVGRAAENIAKLDDFLSQPQVHVAILTRRSAGLYGNFLDQLQSRGTPIPTNDIWISAIAHGCTANSPPATPISSTCRKSGSSASFDERIVRSSRSPLLRSNPRPAAGLSQGLHASQASHPEKGTTVPAAFSSHSLPRQCGP